jgi:hypothetical protein
MDASRDGRLNRQQEVDFDKALELLRKFVDLRQADEMLPLGPGAVYTASVVLWLLVFQRLQPQSTLEAAVKQLIASAPEFCPDNKRLREKTLSPKTGSYSDARQRLPLEVTTWFAQQVSASIIATTRPSLGDRRLFLIDGTTITLAPVKELQTAFPPASNQHGEGVWPVALLLVAHEWESGCALLPEIGPMYGPAAISEVALARTCFQRLPPQSVVMADGGFGIFSVAYAAHQQSHSFLFRLTKTRFNALCRQATLVRKGKGWKTYSHRWVPSPKDRKTNPDLPAAAAVEVQLHEVQVHPDLTLWLVTDLTESGLKLATFYRKRNDVEIDIRNLKVVLKTEEIRARSEAMFRKELYTSIVAYNLVCQFRMQAAQLAEVPTRRLSFTSVWTTYRAFLLDTRLTTPAQWRDRYCDALACARRDLLPNRPGRNYPREAYAKRPKSAQFKKRKRTLDPDETGKKAAK